MSAPDDRDPRCEHDGCSRPAEVRAFEAITVVDGDDIVGHHEPTTTLCFDHFVDMVDRLRDGWRISAVHREASGEWADFSRITPGVRLLLTPELQQRLDEARSASKPPE